MTANLDRVREWTGLLRSGTIEQVSGALVEQIDGDPDKVGMCCLGVGSKLAGLTMDPVEGFLRPDNEWVNSLPPLEFHVWLGLMTQAEATERVGHTRDVNIDWPEGLEVWMQGVSEDDTWTESVVSTDLRSCAGLNDSGFTFSQIADIIDYFGIETE